MGTTDGRVQSLSTALAGLSLLLVADGALAYCRTSHCPGVGPWKVCTPAQADDCGIPLFWPVLDISYSIQKDASIQVSLELTEELVGKAFATWTSAPCDGQGTPYIRVTEAPPADCALQEYSKKHGNANIVVYHDDFWAYDSPLTMLALTTVSYNVDTGEIYDADIELNSANVQLTTSDTAVKYDLLSILTHETGHFLGLAHSPEPGATMSDLYTKGDTSLRELEEDDIQGICAVYPPCGPVPEQCEAIPRHGFSPLCAGDQPAEPSSPGDSQCCCRNGSSCKDGVCSSSEPTGGECVPGACCAIAPGSGRGDSGLPALTAAAVALLGLARRRSRRGR
jgi:hypothetical protein